jgi:hypothetical protein
MNKDLIEAKENSRAILQRPIRYVYPRRRKIQREIIVNIVFV